MPGGRFEVYGYDGSRWLIDSVHESLAAAIGRCEELAADHRALFETVQVIDQEKFANRRAVVHEQARARGKGTPVQIQPISEVSHCERLIDYYMLQARLVVCRLLRGFLDDERITALELMHDYTRLRRLMRDDRLYPKALSHVATLQAKAEGTTPQQRMDAIDKAVERIVQRAKTTHEYGELGEIIEHHGVDAAYASLPKDYGQLRKRVEVAGAVARHLRPHAEWTDKLDVLLAMVPGAKSRATLGILDEAVAEILDNPAAVDEIIGTYIEVSDKLLARIRLARGRWHDPEADADARDVGERLSAQLATGKWTHAPDVLMRQVAKTLKSTQPLRRNEREAKDAFARIVRALHGVGGLAGGPDMADAVTQRARRVEATGPEDLPPESGVTEVMRRLSPRSAQLGYLLSLAASEFGVRYRSVMIKMLTAALKGLSDRDSLLDAGGSRADTQRMIRELQERLDALEAGEASVSQ